MKPKCSQRRPQVLVGPVLHGPDDAMAALRISVGEVDGELIAALVCDADHRLLTAPIFEGAPLDGAPKVLSILLQAVEGMVLPGIVLAVYRPGDSTYVTPDELELLEDLFDQCDGTDADLLDVFIVSGHRWRSITELAGRDPRGDDDDQ
jgi:hypothetical protein